MVYTEAGFSVDKSATKSVSSPLLKHSVTFHFNQDWLLKSKAKLQFASLNFSVPTLCLEKHQI